MFSILQTITCCDYDNKRYVIDGQHRIQAFKILKNLNYPINISIPIVVYNVNDFNEIQNYYIRLNNHHPINPLEITENWKDFGKVFCNWICNEFKTYIKDTTSRSQCPNINLRELMIYINKFKVFERINNIDELINSITYLNNFIITNIKIIKSTQIQSNFVNKIDKCFAKNPTKPCMLGIWRQFEWIEIAIYLIKNELNLNNIYLSQFTKNRPKIVKKKKIEVWNKRNNNTLSGKCFCCEDDLQYDDMECGHIIPFVHGGSIEINNLEPICKKCNRDMGIMNLNEYKNCI
jgi:hypothetical protein